MKITIDLPVDRDWIKEIGDSEEEQILNEMSDAEHLLADLESDYRDFAFYATELIEAELRKEV